MRTMNFLCEVYLIYSLGIIINAEMLDPIATIDDGKLKGTIGKNIDGGKFYQFFGIPYAKPPLDKLRFQPPHPNDPWIGTRDATKVRDSCLSRHDFTRDVVGSEDCLYINVYTKRLENSSTSLQPVMVYIHGGGLVLGSGSPEFYGPQFLMLKDIVLVTFNYRLGVLGFLSFDDAKLGVPGNMGLKDQNLALKWVQKNIKSFNGDPKNVTIFGNSAGGSSVHAHILSPASSGLFHKAILQSGSALNSWFWGSKNNAMELVAHAGKRANSQAEALEVLKNISAREIFDAFEKIYDSPYPSGRRPFSAVQEIPNDTAFLTENPVQILQSGLYNQVPIMIGYAENEGMLLDLDKQAAEKIGNKIPDLDIKKIVPVNLDIGQCENASKEIIEAVSKIYPESILKNSYDPMTDTYFLIGLIQSIHHHLKHAQHPMYLYRISVTSELNQLKRLLNKTHESGVGHSDELGYLFNSIITPPIVANSLEDKYLRIFVQLWTDFAFYGNPTPSSDLGVTWRPLQNIARLDVLDIGSKLQMKDDIPERNRMDGWQKILDKWPLSKFDRKY